MNNLYPVTPFDLHHGREEPEAVRASQPLLSISMLGFALECEANIAVSVWCEESLGDAAHWPVLWDTLVSIFLLHQSGNTVSYCSYISSSFATFVLEDMMTF